MRISRTKLMSLCAERGMALRDLLQKAGVSRTAYYSLARKDSVLPKSIGSLARAFGVSPMTFLEDGTEALVRLREHRARADALRGRHPEVDRDVVFRTLQNLDLPPVERLRRALARAPKHRLRR
jgi:hypothetical protein